MQIKNFKQSRLLAVRHHDDQGIEFDYFAVGKKNVPPMLIQIGVSAQEVEKIREKTADALAHNDKQSLFNVWFGYEYSELKSDPGAPGQLLESGRFGSLTDRRYGDIRVAPARGVSFACNGVATGYIPFSALNILLADDQPLQPSARRQSAGTQAIDRIHEHVLNCRLMENAVDEAGFLFDLNAAIENLDTDRAMRILRGKYIRPASEFFSHDRSSNFAPPACTLVRRFNVALEAGDNTAAAALMKILAAVAQAGLTREAADIGQISDFDVFAAAYALMKKAIVARASEDGLTEKEAAARFDSGVFISHIMSHSIGQRGDAEPRRRFDHLLAQGLVPDVRMLRLIAQRPGAADFIPVVAMQLDLEHLAPFARKYESPVRAAISANEEENAIALIAAGLPFIDEDRERANEYGLARVVAEMDYRSLKAATADKTNRARIARQSSI